MNIFNFIQKLKFEYNHISLKFKLDNSKLWNKIFDQLKYKSINFSNNFIEYQYIYNEYHEKEVDDISLIIFYKDVPIGLVPLFYFKKENKLIFLNNGIPFPGFVDKIDNETENFIIKNIIQFFLKLKKELNLKELIFFQHGPNIKSEFRDLESKQEKILSNDIDYDLYLDLNLDTDEIKKNFRKSYLNIINKKLVDNVNIFDPRKDDIKIWYDFKKLHLEVAARKTRSDQSWEKQLINIKEKKAEFLYYIKDNKLIGGSFFDITIDEAYYSVGAYNDLAKKIYLSHYIQNTAIMHFKSKKIKWYFLGKYFENSNSIISQKEINIAFFKKGFSSDIVKNYKLKY